MRRLWARTERLLGEEADPEVRFRVVVLRAELLDELDPVASTPQG
jgi:hypothetical protein